jgi:autotransporter-associated beta strand protein
MKPKPFCSPFTTLAALLAAQAISLASQPVPVTNAGFENPEVSDGSAQASIPNWTPLGTGDSGILNPSASDFPSVPTEAPEGANVAYVSATTGEAGISQTLGGVIGQLQVDASYTLSVKVGNTAFFTGFPGYRVQLLANGTILAEDNSSLSPAEGAFVTSTINYSYNAGLHSALLGKPLEIRLLGKGTDNTEVDFDDVRLAVTFANPVAIPGGPYAVFIDGSLALNASASLPSDGATITSYEWDLDNDGDFDEAITGATPASITEATLRATYGMKLGGNTIKLKVTDSAAKSAVSEATVNILPASAVVYEPFDYPGTALNGASGTTEAGLTGAWTASVDSRLGPNRAFGPLVTRGAGIGDLAGGQNRFGGARTVNAQALAGNGLLSDGTTLWFSVIMGYDLNGNVTNSRLAFALASNQFSGSNFTYNILNEGVDPNVITGSGIGVTLGNITGNGKVAATRFTNSGSGFAGNTFGNASPVLYGAGQSGLIVGKITWGATSDTIEIYVPGPDLVLPATPVSTLTTNVDQSTFDTITWARGDRVVMDEIRFGASYTSVIESGYSWDLNGTAAGSGGPSPSGTWNAGGSNWNVAPDGTLTPIPWPQGSVAAFSAGNDATDPYTVTVDGTRDVSGLVFEDGTVSLTGGTALRLTANTTVTVGQGLTTTIATPLVEDSAGRQISKAGNGVLVLSANNNALTGGVLINGGAVRFDSPSSIPGTARNISVNSNGVAVFGSGFGAGNIPAALAGRVAASSAGAIAADNYETTAFDFNTPGLTAASLGAVGSVSYSGLLTPNGTIYRLGGGGGTLTLSGANPITGENSLVASGSGTVVLASDCDYTGTTTVNAGCILRIMGATTTSGVTVNQPASILELGHNAALGAGTLTFGGGFATAPMIRAIGTVVLTNPITASGGFNIGGTGSLSLGIVTLNNNIIINNDNITNATTYAAFTASGGVRTLTFSGNGDSIVTGDIGGGTNISNITKNGNGTLRLNGANAYTGTMTVNNAGTLLVVSPGLLPAGAMTLNNTSILSGDGAIGGNVTVTATANIAPGNGVGTLPIAGNLTVTAMAGGAGTLRYQLGPIASSDKITVGGTLTIGTGTLGFTDFVFTDAGGLQNGTYKLITSTGGITGTLNDADLTGTIGSAIGTLQIAGNDIDLVVTGVPSGSAYANWAATNAPSGNPGDDFDGDGVPNAVEFVLGGDKDTNDSGKLPVVATSGSDMTVTFRRDQDSIDPTTSLAIEVGTDLATWPDSFIVPDGAAANTPGVTVAKDSPATGTDTVTLTIPRAPDARKFARLKVVITP